MTAEEGNSRVDSRYEAIERGGCGMGLKMDGTAPRARMKLESSVFGRNFVGSQQSQLLVSAFAPSPKYSVPLQTINLILK